jgi:hypothetical protein
MLKFFSYIYKAIKVVINNFNSKAFKNKSLILIEIKLMYSNNILDIISILLKLLQSYKLKLIRLYIILY